MIGYGIMKIFRVIFARDTIRDGAEDTGASWRATLGATLQRSINLEGMFPSQRVASNYPTTRYGIRSRFIRS